MAWNVEDEGLRTFLKRTGQHRLLGAEEELRLTRAMAAGDRRARELLIEHNIRLVLSIARTFDARGLDSEDLIMEGIVGLHIAADKFDPELGYRFSTYATWWIRKACQRGLSMSGQEMIRLPTAVRQCRGRSLAAMAEHPEWTLAEVAAHIEDTEDNVRAAITAAMVVTSLNENRPDADEGPHDHLHDQYADDPQDVLAGPSALLAEALSALPATERTIIELRFGLYGEALTLEEIGRKLRKPMHVVQAGQRRALALLRSAMLASSG